MYYDAKTGKALGYTEENDFERLDMLYKLRIITRKNYEIERDILERKEYHRQQRALALQQLGKSLKQASESLKESVDYSKSLRERQRLYY